jgi:uncharacterized lipoprotein YddW (UPF0748 family)
MSLSIRSALLIALFLITPLRAQVPRILLYGESYMDPISQALDRIGLPYERLDRGSLGSRAPAQVDALFLAFDAGTDSTSLAWIGTVLDRGGKLFTFYQLPSPLQERLGIRTGKYLRPETPTFAQIHLDQTLPHVPPVVHQNSANIILVSPTADSVRVIATWHDPQGNSTGHPALLLSPDGAHLTHVLLGHDPAGAARLYTALLGHFFPDVWNTAVRGALEAIARIGGGSDSLAVLAAPVKKARKDLERAEEARRQALDLLSTGDFSNALDAAFQARALTVRALARSQNSQRGEFRGVWLHTPYGVGDWGWDKTCRILAENGFNAIVPNMLDAGRTSYPSRTLPVDPRVKERGNQLMQAVSAAHKYGLAIHAWKVNFNLSTADSAFVARMRAEERLQRDVDGEEVTWLCPSHPDNFDLEVASLLEVVRNYPVDGLHFDYIRYPNSQGCFCQGCRLRFETQTGHQVDTWPEDVVTGELAEIFQPWRRQQITRLVRTVSIKARHIRSAIKISAAVFSDWPQTRLSIGQDWVEWIEEGYLDFVCPMDYIPDTERFHRTVERQVDWVGGRVPLYAGIGAFRLPHADDLIAQIDATRRAGADGFILFEYSTWLGEKVLPLLHQGITAEKTHPPHRGPRVWFDLAAPSFRGLEPGEEFHRAGEELSVHIRLFEDPLAMPQSGSRILLCDLGGEQCQDMGKFVRDETGLFTSLMPDPGDYRLVIEGQYRDPRGRKHSFTRRSPVLRVRDHVFLDSLQQLYGAPKLPEEGIPIGIFIDGYGGRSLLQLLEERQDLTPFPVHFLTPSVLEATRILIIPQPRQTSRVNRQIRLRLRQWIADGGRLLVTHDMVGIRGLLPVVPEICQRGTGFPNSSQWQVTSPDHPAVAGLPSGLQSHAYYDHISLEPGPDGTVLATDEENRPILVVGSHGQGNYAALGLIPGLAPGDIEAVPTGAERLLVESLVEWLVDGL